METNFNFKSAICTDRNQSERLLTLGLKPETADCGYFYDNRANYAFFHHWACSPYKWHKDSLLDNENIPAWSLYRLIEMMPTIIKRHQQVWTLSLNGAGVLYLRQDMVAIVEALADNLFDNIIGCIEWLIKEGYFPKEYLV